MARAPQKVRVQWTVTKARLDEVRALMEEAGMPRYMLSPMADMMLLALGAQLRAVVRSLETGKQLELGTMLEGIAEAGVLAEGEVIADRGAKGRGDRRGTARRVRKAKPAV